LGRYATENGKAVESFRDDTRSMLEQYDWPGNVRELENAVERAVVLCDGKEVEPRHLPANVRSDESEGRAPQIPGATIAELERYAIIKTLEACKGSTSKAALLLGISARKIQYKLHEYGDLSMPRDDESDA
jgi:DNA-binding NtrC family response regulator